MLFRSGSGLAYAGGDTFLALPDRGPNGGPFTFNACLDETASYINRFQTVQLQLSAGPGLYGLPFTLTPNLQATTLLVGTPRRSFTATASHVELRRAPPR